MSWNSTFNLKLLWLFAVDKGQPEHLSACRPRSRSSNEENHEDAMPLPAFVKMGDRLPMPKTYRKAVDIVTDELLEAYKCGEEARLVVTFNQWYNDRPVYENIVYDCFKRLKRHGHNYVPVDETETENYCYEFRAYVSICIFYFKLSDFLMLKSI